MIPSTKITEELVQLQGKRFIASVQALDKRITEEKRAAVIARERTPAGGQT